MAVERKKATVVLGVVTLIAALALSTLTVTAGASSSKANALPRAATLYTSGTAWAPFAQFNPLRSSGNATGTVGLLYETLFRYDPLKDRYIPWLATSGKWVGNTYVVTLRKGVTWNDGKPFTGADVKFTFETGKLEGSELSTMWKTGLQAITVKGNVVSFRFKGQPNYLDWATNIFTFGIVPAHVWKNYAPRRSRPATPTSTSSAPARSRTAPARERRERCSGTGGATGGRRSSSGSRCPCSTSSTSTTRRTPRRCRTS